LNKKRILKGGMLAYFEAEVNLRKTQIGALEQVVNTFL